MLLRHGWALALALASSLASAAASAQQAAAGSVAPAGGGGRAAEPSSATTADVSSPDGFRSSYVLDDARPPVLPPNPESHVSQLHGEYQLRYTRLSDLPLMPYRGLPETRRLAQRNRVEHWLRWSPQIHFGAHVSLFGQIDIPRGFIAGDTTTAVDMAYDSYAERQPFDFEGRWLYLEWRAPFGVVRAGQQPSHWGIGLVANDGNHPSLFGDYRHGDRNERIAFGTRPFGAAVPFNVAVAADLVFADEIAQYRAGQHAWQGVLAAFYETERDMAGLYAVYRFQTEQGAVLPGRTFDQDTQVLALDLAGRHHHDLSKDAYFFASAEAALQLGTTGLVRNVELTRQGELEKLRAFGGAVEMGAVQTTTSGAARFGRFVGALEWGWASGDANPYDGVSKRFRMDPNHNVGLLLFDEVLKWKTARSATQAMDGGLAQRPAPGVRLLPTDGSIAGATYLYPSFIYRPLAALDLKAAAVLAMTTADFVDPVQTGLTGRFQNFDGGGVTGRDLGIELDGGVEYRVALAEGVTLPLGAQTAVLFPGGAFADASGKSLGTQGIGVARAGLVF